MIKIRNLKLGILLEYQNIEIFSLKVTLHTPNWCGEVFVIKKVKNAVSWTYFISGFKGNEIFGTVYKK